MTLQLPFFRTFSLKLRLLPFFLLLYAATLSQPLHAQKWKYDFVVPRDGNYAAAIRAANNRADKRKRFRIFIHSSNYRIGSTTVTLTAPNTSIIGEEWQNTQIEACMEVEGLDKTGTLIAQRADSTYIQDIELWSNYKNDANLFANRAVALSEKHCRGNVLKNVSLLGTQDTYYTNTGGTTYLEDCRIAGTVDFICGGGTVYFNHCDIRLVSRGDSTKHDIICAPATESERQYGYVFSDCYIDGPRHQQRNYWLGRPWQNAPRATFLNCCMNIEPMDEGWTNMHGTQPAYFAEFESYNRVFEPLDLSKRRTRFKDKQGVERTVGYQPRMTPEVAEQYTVKKVFGAWDPTAKAEQVVPPVLTLKGREITWPDIPEAGCYAICRNRMVVAFTTEPRYTVPAGTSEGTGFSVRCANQMGGLGLRSAEVFYPQR